MTISMQKGLLSNKKIEYSTFCYIFEKPILDYAKIKIKSSYGEIVKNSHFS